MLNNFETPSSAPEVYLIADLSRGPVARSPTLKLCSSDWKASAWAAAGDPVLMDPQMGAQALDVGVAAGPPSALSLLISCV